MGGAASRIRKIARKTDENAKNRPNDGLHSPISTDSGMAAVFSLIFPPLSRWLGSSAAPVYVYQAAESVAG